MSLLPLCKRSPPPEESNRNLGFEVSDCSPECEGFSSKYPASVKFNDYDNSRLYGNTKLYGLHTVVATNKSDWNHDATLIEGTLIHAVEKWVSNSSFAGLGESATVKVSVSSL